MVFKYIFNKEFRADRERNTDKETISRGLGEELKIGVEKILESDVLPNSSKVKTEEFYLSPDEIHRMSSKRG